MKTTKAVIGKWPSVLPLLGIDSNYLTGKHTRCPICCTGKDKFRFDDLNGRGTFICNDCGSGTGWKLLESVHGWGFKEAANRIDKVLCNAADTPVRATKNIDANRARLKRIQIRMKPLGSTNTINQYLLTRGISSEVLNTVSNQLCLVPGLEYYEGGEVTAKFDSMVAKVKLNSEPITFHVTYLFDGDKADVSVPRKVMPPIKPMSGSAVELFAYDEVLGVAEGIETALACTQMFEVPTWATLNCNNMKAFRPPEGVKHLYVFGDNDQSYAGQEAAHILTKQAVAAGLTVSTRIPEKLNTDWNDVLVELNQEKN
jgi:putative DNA primase/helicase